MNQKQRARFDAEAFIKRNKRIYSFIFFISFNLWCRFTVPVNTSGPVGDNNSSAHCLQTASWTLSSIKKVILWLRLVRLKGRFAPELHESFSCLVFVLCRSRREMNGIMILAIKRVRKMFIINVWKQI